MGVASSAARLPTSPRPPPVASLVLFASLLAAGWRRGRGREETWAAAGREGQGPRGDGASVSLAEGSCVASRGARVSGVDLPSSPVSTKLQPHVPTLAFPPPQGAGRRRRREAPGRPRDGKASHGKEGAGSRNAMEATQADLLPEQGWVNGRPGLGQRRAWPEDSAPMAHGVSELLAGLPPLDRLSPGTAREARGVGPRPGRSSAHCWAVERSVRPGSGEAARWVSLTSAPLSITSGSGFSPGSPSPPPSHFRCQSQAQAVPGL